MTLESKAQVKEGHYRKRSYNTLERFISYFYQIDITQSLDSVRTIMELGPGSKLVSGELMRLGYLVTTCDFDKNVEPDIVADVRLLPKDKTYDLIMACQILEHIPYADAKKVFADLARISNRYVLISLPERHTGFNVVFKLPFVQTIFKKKLFDWSLRFPIRFPVGISKKHYWEIDFWNISKRKVRLDMQEHFIILREFSPPLNKYHRFFILEKKYHQA